MAHDTTTVGKSLKQKTKPGFMREVFLFLFFTHIPPPSPIYPPTSYQAFSLHLLFRVLAKRDEVTDSCRVFFGFSRGHEIECFINNEVMK